MREYVRHARWGMTDYGGGAGIGMVQGFLVNRYLRCLFFYFLFLVVVVNNKLPNIHVCG